MCFLGKEFKVSFIELVFGIIKFISFLWGENMFIKFGVCKVNEKWLIWGSYFKVSMVEIRVEWYSKLRFYV